jgi:hypothetical protein
MNKEAKVTLLALVALGAFVYAGAHVGEAMGLMDAEERNSRQASRHRFDQRMEGRSQHQISMKVFDFSELTFSSDAVGTVQTCRVRSVRNLMPGLSRPAYPPGTVARATLDCQRPSDDDSRAYDRVDLALQKDQRDVLDTPKGTALKVHIVASAGEGYARMPVVRIPR